jgi:hypothetical protein
LGGKPAGKEKVREIVRSMIRDNHPISVDGSFNIVKHGREEGSPGGCRRAEGKIC